MRDRALLAALLAIGSLAAAGQVAATLVTKPVTKGLRDGAIYQARLDKRSCYGSSARVKLGNRRCSALPELGGASTTIKPAVAADSGALYVAAKSGVLVLKRDSAGGLAYDSCVMLIGGCGRGENDEGAVVSELALGPDGRQLYVLLDRQRDGGVEIHTVPIGADDRLSASQSCLLLISQSEGDPDVTNPRNCNVAVGDDHVGGYSLALTPNGRFAYLISTARGTSTAGIVEMARAADGALSILPGCVSTNGARGRDADQCETLLATGEGRDQTLNLSQLAISPDSADLVVRGEDTFEEDRGLLVRFAINADGSLTRSRAATACVNATGKNGCARSPAMAGSRSLSPIAIVGRTVYVGAAHQSPADPDLVTSRVLGFRLASDGGLSLPAGAAGCVGNITRSSTRIKKVDSCSLGREALRNPAGVVAGPDGATLYVVGFLKDRPRGIALLRVSGGAPRPVSGPSGCFLDGSIGAREKTRCNKPFGPGALADAEQTFTLSPDGRAAYVLSAVRATDFVRLSVLRRQR